MKRRTWPLWLLRDVPACVGVMLSFWPLMILVIANGLKAMAGKKIPRAVYDAIMQMLPVAEARLRYALERQACRALGWNPRYIRLELIPAPQTWPETRQRFDAYIGAMLDLRAAAQTFTDQLSRYYSIRTRADANAVRVSHMSAPGHRAIQHQLADDCVSSTFALIPGSARGARPSKNTRVLTGARGPPLPPRFRHSAHTRLRSTPLLRPHPHAYAFTSAVRVSTPHRRTTPWRTTPHPSGNPQTGSPPVAAPNVDAGSSSA